MDRLVANGIDGTTGRYLLEDIDLTKVVQWALGRRESPLHLAELRQRDSAGKEAHLGLKEGLDPKDLAQAGWGVIFAAADGEADRKKVAIAPLLEMRKRQAGDRYREFSGADAVRKGESKFQFLARHGIGTGPADPERMPYYLLICASPESIPYEFQYQLDVQYAVGRIHFDSLEEYEQYASTLVAAERGTFSRARQAVFFGVENPDDQATALSTKHLVEPLAARLERQTTGWQIDKLSAEGATRASLAELLAREQGPALLFTASHGMGFPNGHPRQRRHQGALLCQDWPGPEQWGAKPIPATHYFSADDVGNECRVGGLVTFHFACYSGGTPRADQFTFSEGAEPPQIAPEPFVASLPNRLLAHPNGGALAAVAHVDRAWSYSFSSAWTGAQVGVFESMLMRLFSAYPVGAALEYFNERYAELATMLTSLLEDIRHRKVYEPVELAGLWTAHNDARNYVIIGDPAVKLVVA